MAKNAGYGVCAECAAIGCIYLGRDGTAKMFRHGPEGVYRPGGLSCPGSNKKAVDPHFKATREGDKA